jgi:hypothetical protein
MYACARARMPAAEVETLVSESPMSITVIRAALSGIMAAVIMTEKRVCAQTLRANLMNFIILSLLS